MLVNITEHFVESGREWQVGQNPDVPREVAAMWIADGKATADTDGVRNQSPVSGGGAAPPVTAAQIIAHALGSYTADTTYEVADTSGGVDKGMMVRWSTYVGDWVFDFARTCGAGMGAANIVLNAPQKAANTPYVAGATAGDALVMPSGASYLPYPFVLPGEVVRVAFYGDSRANSPGTAAGVYDVRAVTMTAPAATTSYWSNTSKSLLSAINPSCQIVANCGISGDNLDQMIARESAGASSTRKAIADMVGMNASVAIVHMGINSITSAYLGGGYTSYQQSITDSLWLKVKDLLQRKVSAGLFVLDCGDGAWEHTNTATYPAGMQQGIRQTIIALNALRSAYADASGGRIVYFDEFSLSANADGTWKTYAYCSDVGGSLTPPANTQLVHPSFTLGTLMAAGQNALIKKYFGVPHPAYTRNYIGLNQGNLISNANLSSSSAGLGTGWSTVASGTGASKTSEIVDFGGKLYQCCKATFSAPSADNYVEVLLPVSNLIGGSALVDGGQYGLEFDWFIDNGAGGAPSVGATGSTGIYQRARFYTAGGSAYMNALSAVTGDFGFAAASFGRAVFPAFSFSGWSSADITTAQIIFHAGRTDAETQRIGVSSPRLVRIA